jgi:hypothetical protein
MRWELLDFAHLNAWWILAAAGVLVAALAAIFDRRRQQGRRKNLDRPGWAPWPTIQIAALIVAAVAAAFAVKG